MIGENTLLREFYDWFGVKGNVSEVAGEIGFGMVRTERVVSTCLCLEKRETAFTAYGRDVLHLRCGGASRRGVSDNLDAVVGGVWDTV